MSQRVGPYTILAVLQKQPLAAVYRARNETLQTEVTLKVVKNTARYLERLRRDVSVLSVQRHENVAPILDSGETADSFYFATPVPKGCRLSELVLANQKAGHAPPVSAARFFSTLGAWPEIAAGFSRGPLTQVVHDQNSYAVSALLVAQLAEAIGFLFDQDIICANLNPDTVIVTPEGRAILLDFHPPLSGDETLSGELGDLLKYLRYLAPEQTQEQSATRDVRSHVYGLGALLYELATLHAPFEELRDARQLLQFVRLEPPARPTQLAPNIPPVFEHVVLKCLSKHKEERYASAHELARELKRLVFDQQIMNLPALAPMLDAPEAPKLIGTRVSATSRNTASVQKPRAPEKPRKSWVPLLAVLAFFAAIPLGLMWYVGTINKETAVEPKRQPVTGPVGENNPQREVAQAEREIQQKKAQPAEAREAMRKHHQATEEARNSSAAAGSGNERAALENYRSFYEKLQQDPGINSELRAACQMRIALARYELGELDAARDTLSKVAATSADAYDAALFESLQAAVGTQAGWELLKPRFLGALQQWQEQDMPWETAWFLSLFSPAAIEHGDATLAAQLALLECRAASNAHNAAQLQRALEPLQKLARTNSALHERATQRLGGWTALMLKGGAGSRAQAGTLWRASTLLDAARAMRVLVEADDSLRRRYKNKSLFDAPEMALAMELQAIAAQLSRGSVSEAHGALRKLAAPEQMAAPWSGPLLSAHALYSALAQIEIGEFEAGAKAAEKALDLATKFDAGQVALAHGISGYATLLKGRDALPAFTHCVREYQSVSNGPALSAAFFLLAAGHAAQRSNPLAAECFASGAAAGQNAEFVALTKMHQAIATQLSGQTPATASEVLAPDARSTLIALALGAAVPQKFALDDWDADTRATWYYLAGMAEMQPEKASVHLERYFISALIAAAPSKTLDDEAPLRSVWLEAKGALLKNLSASRNIGRMKVLEQGLAAFEAQSVTGREDRAQRKRNQAFQVMQRFISAKDIFESTALIGDPNLAKLVAPALQKYETAARAALQTLPEDDRRIARARFGGAL